MTTTLITLALIALLILIALPIMRSRMNVIAPETARQLVDDGALLLDVRTPQEFGETHLPGALNIPLQELETRVEELPRDRTLVLYCRSGNRSSMARRILLNQGFDEVHDLGALSRWH